MKLEIPNFRCAETPPLKEDSEMGRLTPDELVSLTPKIVSLLQEVKDSLRPDEDGEVRVTKEEAKALRACVLSLAAALIKESLD